jgi:hypothetical protein
VNQPFNNYSWQLRNGEVPPELCPDEDEMREFLKTHKFHNEVTKILPYQWNYIEHLRIFNETFKKSLENIYYPSSGSDYSPSIVFHWNKIIYADGSVFSMRALWEMWCTTYNEDVTIFDTKALISEIHLLLLFNPNIRYSEIEKNLNLKGYILCNNRHGNATELKQRSDFKLIWVIRSHTKNTQLFFDTENLDHFWEEVENEEELINAEFSESTLTYIAVKDLVERVLNKPTKDIKVFDAFMDIKNKFIANNYKIDGENERYQSNLRVFFNLWLPKKKWGIDDVFVFATL